MHQLWEPVFDRQEMPTITDLNFYFDFAVPDEVWKLMMSEKMWRKTSIWSLN